MNGNATGGVLWDFRQKEKRRVIFPEYAIAWVELSKAAWLMCVIETTIPTHKPRDTQMLNGTTEITADDCYFAHLAASELLDELRQALDQQTIPTEGKKEMLRFFRRMDDLHDALDSLTSRFPVKRTA